jgi:peptidoglycan/LPS O-acetylase OafA/YrhL
MPIDSWGHSPRERWAHPLAADERTSAREEQQMNKPALVALVTDVLCVVVFCAIGRRSHAEGLNLTGIAETAWPFLAGTGVGWLLARGWRRPQALLPTGVVIWVCTVAIGMLLRKATSQGVAPSFVVVASLATALLLLGWRTAAWLMTRG